MNTLVLKIGGNELDIPEFVEELATEVAAMAVPPIVVHGGGKEIARLQQQLGLTPRFVEGLRVTDEASLRVAEMVLSGLVNKRLVAALVTAGVQALGFSGVDLGLICVEKMQHPTRDLGRVGRIVAVRGEVLKGFLSQGIVPVVSPISAGADGLTYNVNADHVAVALAQAIRAEVLVFVTNVPGVLVHGQPVARLTTDEARALIAEGHVTGGMVPKVRSALAAVEAGIGRARITNLTGMREGGGTTVSAEEEA